MMNRMFCTLPSLEYVSTKLDATKTQIRKTRAARIIVFLLVQPWREHQMSSSRVAARVNHLAFMPCAKSGSEISSRGACNIAATLHGDIRMTYIMTLRDVTGGDREYIIKFGDEMKRRNSQNRVFSSRRLKRELQFRKRNAT